MDLSILDRLDLNALKRIEEFVNARIERLQPDLTGLSASACWVWEGACCLDDEPVLGFWFEGDFYVLLVYYVTLMLQGKANLGASYVRTCGNSCCVNPDHFRLADVSLPEIELNVDTFPLDCVVDLNAKVDAGLAVLEQLSAGAAEAIAKSSLPGRERRSYRRRSGVRSRCPEGLLLCEDCKQCLPPSEFAKNKASPTGYQRKCRRCRRLYDQRRRAAKRRMK